MYAIKEFIKKHPFIGLRTFKTVIAVLITSVIFKYVLHQNPFFACIGAVVAMDKTMAASIKGAIIRNVGTITGGLIGIAVSSFTENILIMSCGLVPFIWVNNFIGKKESIVPGAIVYFAVFYLNTMEQAWGYGITRILGTFAGTLIALLVNRLIAPPKAEEAENKHTTANSGEIQKVS